MIAIDPAVFDIDVVAELADVLGPDAVETLVAAFARELRSGPAAILEHLGAGDVPAARFAAHHLKGAALVVGARAIALAAERVEFGEIDQIDAHAHALIDLSAAHAALF